ncbi:MAG TPA: response regulator FixJ [Pseudolabrys sp.]|nr:response regulator FixJ [Pseudolabrys sp.]
MARAGTAVYVVDDEEAIRARLEFLLRDAGFSVRSFESAKEFLTVLPQIQSGCIVTDVRMPEVTGIELLRHVMATKPHLPVIVMTGMGDIALAVDAMKTGAIDFLEKPFEDGPLLSAVKTAVRREEEASKRNAEDAAIRGKIDSLSQRERQVLEGLLSGSPNKIIAYDLGISSRTIEKYRANLMVKMAAKSVSDLVRMAIRAGLPSDIRENRR